MSKSILVSFADGRITVSQEEAIVKTIEQFAIGRPGHQTPIFEDGSLSLTKRDRNHRSASYPPPHGGAQMPFALFFQQDLACAFHEGPIGVASHGCVHLDATNAEWLFDWAGHDPVGLTIRGPYPADPLFPHA
jgi:hypothetical protein